MLFFPKHSIIIRIAVSLFIMTLAIFLLADFALAATDFGLDQIRDTGLGTADLRTIIARIIALLISFLGIIAVCIIIYAGFIWMTSGGNSEKIDKAKRILKGAVIGLVLILLSYIIASFILNFFGGGNGGGDMYKSTYDPLHLDKVKSVYDGAIGNAQLADGAVNNAKISSAGQLADRVLTADGNGNTIWTGKATGVGDVTAGGDTTDGNIPIWTAVNKQLSNTGLYFLGAHGNAWETFNQWIIPNPQACDARFEPTIGSKGSAFNKNYGGDGSADSISRSDHTHFGLNRHDFKPYNNNAGQTVILDASFFEKTVIVYNTKTVATGGVVSLWLDWSVAASGNYTGRVIKIVAVAQHDAAFDTGALVISVMGPFGYLSFGNVMSGGYAVVRYQTDNSVYSPGFCAILECTPDPNGSWMVLNGDTHGWSVYNSP